MRIPRLLLACSLLAALSSAAAADRSEPSFARPPAGWSAKPAADLSPPHAPLTTRLLDRDAVRAKLEAARAARLAHFRAYRLRGSYPSNVSTPGFANVWRDLDGKYCAAATILRASGHEALAAQVAEEDNGLRLADVTSGPVLDWMLVSGLTQEELALIQRPFRRVTPGPGPETKPEPAAIDPRLRAAETRRLSKLYAAIEAKLVASHDASLSLAVDRLVQRPALAHALLADGAVTSAAKR